jgi:hypothetical protein
MSITQPSFSDHFEETLLMLMLLLLRKPLVLQLVLPLHRLKGAQHSWLLLLQQQ